MKKITSLLLSLCMVLLLAACGGSTDEPEKEDPFAQYTDGGIVTDLTGREWIVERNNPEYYMTSDGTIIGVNNAPDDDSVYLIGVVSKTEGPAGKEPDGEEAGRPAPGEIVYDDDGTPWVVAEDGEFCFVNGFVCTDPTDEDGKLIEGWFPVDRYNGNIDSGISDTNYVDPYDIGDPDLYGANAKTDSFYDWDSPTSDTNYVDPYDIGDPELYGANAKADSFYEWDNPTIVTDAEGNQWIVVSADGDYYMTPDGYVISDPTDEEGNLRNDLIMVCAWD